MSQRNDRIGTDGESSSSPTLAQVGNAHRRTLLRFLLLDNLSGTVRLLPGARMPMRLLG